MFKLANTQSPLRQAITAAYLRPEKIAVADVLTRVDLSAEQLARIEKMARGLVQKVREGRQKSSGVDALMQEFSLSSEEGVALMCLAEALLRIPDDKTRDNLIADKLSGGDWKKHLNHSPSLFVNAAAWGLLVAGKLTQPETKLDSALNRALKKGGEPLIRQGVNYAMRLLGKQFVTGQTIEEALKNGKAREARGYRFSFDMLGEAAFTQADADRYFNDYVQAIHAIGQDAAGAGVYEGNGISVKLSAIHPRYVRAQHARVMQELLPRLKELFLLAKQYNIGLNIDAEEANRLDLSLDLLTELVKDPDLKGFNGIGFVVQAYQKRCPFVIEYLIDLARKNEQKLMIRLVKGAYWDSEIKWAQIDGLADYPVYTRKVHTDVSYLACAKLLLSAQDCIFPQFATHNAYTLAAVIEMGKGKEFEHQCLHGMGETLYDQVVEDKEIGRRCRIYAPVGTHETLLAYLVRRLLENGANSSFVNQIVDEAVSIDDLVRSPLAIAEKTAGSMHQGVPLPSALYGSRKNSKGLNLNDESTLEWLETTMNAACQNSLQATPLTAVENLTLQTAMSVKNPADHQDIVGEVQFATVDSIKAIISQAKAAEASWQQTSPAARAEILQRFADLLEENMPLLMMLAVREAGKTLANAIAEVREAVDFCRYYAEQALWLGQAHRPIGTVVAISPWNFPLAIFVGELTAALAVGNTVVVKPAEQTSLIAYVTIGLLQQAGLPKNVLQLVLGAGDIGAALVADERINGVVFTGSTAVAKLIQKTLSARDDLPVLIAETGGQNAMIVDSSALPEQVAADVLASAFDSAGQRCSALRILCLQEDIADNMLKMIKGALDELRLGNPKALNVDVGPVIDKEAQENLAAHIQRTEAVAEKTHRLPMPADLDGTYIAPTIFELPNLAALTQEVFGPVLHVVRYRADELDALIDAINAKGYALTHGIHSRIDRTISAISARIEAGNIYINRNIVGAVVGVQPFGGHGLSGTGPKAGGPFYLQRLSQGKWQAPALTETGQVDEKRYETLKQQLQANGFLAILSAQTTPLCHARMPLVGPTGEENSLSWRAPHRVWLYGGTLEEAVPAYVQLALAGVETVVSTDHPLAAWQASSAGLLQVSDEAVPSVEKVLALSPLPSDLKMQLADKLETVVQIYSFTETGGILPIFEEVSVSYNTSAAGGNASLMAMAEEG